MQPSLDVAIRGKLTDYLSGNLSLRDFNRWFIPASWNVEQSGNVEAARLVGEIGLALAEFSAGHWTEHDLRRIFSPLVTTYPPKSKTRKAAI